MAKLSKKVMLGILDKLEIEYTSKITLARAKSKLERALQDGGLPEDAEMTEAEVAALEEMGFEVDLDDDDEDQEPSDQDLEDIDNDFDDDDEDQEPSDQDLEDIDDDEDEDDEDEDEPAPEPKKGKKKSAPKEKKEKKAAPKEKSKKKMGKYTAICKILKKKKNHTLPQLAEDADALYVKNGGPSNVDGTLKFVVTTVKVLEEYGIVAVDGESVKML